MREEARNGRTFLWYTHGNRRARQLRPHLCLQNGRIVANLRRDELTEEKIILSSFGYAPEMTAASVDTGLKTSSERGALRVPLLRGCCRRCHWRWC